MQMDEGLAIGGMRGTEEYKSVVIAMVECTFHDYCESRKKQHEYYKELSISAIASENLVNFLDYEHSV